ncbi:uncharacterized protein LOC121971603 [Zingiber officinale]|uniref:uncharacterized protein LOC121971603 n=1 Tax=Zingiber officinale TaxID=94328 RepID=UPI001C4D1E98|nr:uncharacterized protein LOC121971603 [Zingiber officinale]XP_042378874.1 uncharacterized protein LOC121971603 [Zingiber officinale]XP_042378875.1 uncharacterized protein LOC121971603 [Zingiber officinale]
MATEKELVDDIRDVGKQLESPPADVDDLLTLLDQTEQLLMRVHQAPSQSIIDVLHPAMSLLVDKRLLRHPNEDVKAIVASCTNEIMRITAPDAPYNDDLMKEVFGNIVDTLDKLDDISNDSFFKRVSILDTFAKVRSFIVMLDLECDALVLNMFRIFLRTIRPNHSEGIFSSMETIMTVLLEESDYISEGLLFCLLDVVKIDNKNTLPIAHKLAERVITACASKLKPYLGKFVKPRVCLKDYSKVVASIIEGNYDFGGQNAVNSANVKELANTKREDPDGTKPKMLAAAKRKIVGEVSSVKQNSEKDVAGETRKKIRKLDERLVGDRIQVWWPDDQQFYTGTIKEYDHVTKKHKVLYDDGDVEILLLKEERWMFASEIRTSPTCDFADDAKDAIDASLDNKAVNTKSNSTAGETNVEAVIKSTVASSELPKRKGRPPKVGRSIQSKLMEDVSPKVEQKPLFKDMHEPRSKVTELGFTEQKPLFNDEDILRSKQNESTKLDQKPKDIPSLNASGGEPKTSLNPQKQNS